jgi:hypothetical protein
MTKQHKLFKELTDKYIFNDTLENDTDYFKVYESHGITYYSPNDEDLGAIMALDFEKKLAVYTGFYDTHDFEPTIIDGERFESDYLFINHLGKLISLFETYYN